MYIITGLTCHCLCPILDHIATHNLAHFKASDTGQIYCPWSTPVYQDGDIVKARVFIVDISQTNR